MREQMMIEDKLIGFCEKTANEAAIVLVQQMMMFRHDSQRALIQWNGEKL